MGPKKKKKIIKPSELSLARAILPGGEKMSSGLDTFQSADLNSIPYSAAGYKEEEEFMSLR